MSRYSNENSKTPDGMPMPRIVYPNDILPDENSLSEMSKQAQSAVVKTDSNNSQTVIIKPHNLEKLSKREKYDSTLDERDRTYSTQKAEPRFNEYR